MPALARAQRPAYLDLVRVHAGVGDQDVGVLDPLGLVHADRLVQQEACEEQEEMLTLVCANIPDRLINTLLTNH